MRLLDRHGKVHWGEDRGDGTAQLLEGSPGQGFQPVGKVEEIGRLLAPVVPPVIWCVGLNYRRHAEETKAPLPEYPVLFMKPITAVQDPGRPIVLPRGLASDRVDYECELAIVIGRRGKNITPEQADRHVLGFTCANDVSARDWQIQRGGGQWCRGKSFDTFCPLGPAVVTLDEIPDSEGLPIRTWVSGELLQDWNTRDMIFGWRELVAFISGSTTLEPGTVILTGTPHGVGMARTPRRWLVPGDEVTVEIDGIGALTNPVEEEIL